MSDLAHVSGQVDARGGGAFAGELYRWKKNDTRENQPLRGGGCAKGREEGRSAPETRTFGGVALEDGGSCASESEGSGASVGALARSRGRAPPRWGAPRTQPRE